MLIVVIPVVIMSFVFVWRYRQAHRAADYKPNWSHSVFLEGLWWGVPCLIILILGIMTWILSHRLDPYHKIGAPGVDHGKPLLIKVVALPWKWLFIYPKQNIATVNFLELPKNRQVKFLLTSDNVPMSAFFIPQLGSQIYTMAGMQTKLHLIATETGTFKGLNSQYNGDGFSDMKFDVKVVSQKGLEHWFSSVKNVSQRLDWSQYQAVRQPAVNAQVKYFSGVQPGIFKKVISSYHAQHHPGKKYYPGEHYRPNKPYQSNS